MHRLDVDDMLAEMTPEQFDGWWAADALDPIDDGWRQAGTISATIANVVAQAVSSEPIPRDDLLTHEAFIPRLECLGPIETKDDQRPLTAARSAQLYGAAR